MPPAAPRTPSLDRMADEGIRLTSFYVAQAVCSASRAALLTGAYPNRIGIRGALNHTATRGLSHRETTMAEMLKARGYATAAFGKWHLGHAPPYLPKQHGFDEYFGLPYSNDMWPRHPQQKDFYPDLPLIDGDVVVERDADQRQLTRRYTERAVRFIEAQSGSSVLPLRAAHDAARAALRLDAVRRGQRDAGCTPMSSRRSTGRWGRSWRRSPRPASTSGRW